MVVAEDDDGIPAILLVVVGEMWLKIARLDEK